MTTNKNDKGKLLILCGTDSSGKTSQAGLLVERENYTELRLPDYELETGKLIKQFNNSGKKDIEESAYQSLMMANYLEVLYKKIMPMIEQGKDVVMTRFTPSANIYGDVFAKSILEREYIVNLTDSIEYVYKELTNYQILFLDITAEEAEKRIEYRHNNSDQKREPVFESPEMIDKITKRYKNYYNKYTLVINGMQDRESVYQDIIDRIKR